jgi:RNA polymerase-interacting CarD/CdnL/TRCF family regulator
VGAFGQERAHFRHHLVTPGLHHHQRVGFDPPHRAQPIDRARHQIAAVRRIEEHQPARRSRRRRQHIHRQHRGAILSATRRDIAAQRRQRRPVVLHERRMRRAARQSLQPERAGAGERIQHAGTLHDVAATPGRMQ